MTVPAISLDTLSSYGGKPKDYYLLEFFRLYEKYWDEMSRNGNNDLSIDITTGMLIAFCPHKPTREDLWDKYVAKKETKGALTASILTAGDFFTYLSDTLEFTEEAFASA